MELRVENITKYYEDKQVLKNINFKVEENSSLGIMGESGSGKSTLVRLLTGLEKADEGEIFIDNISFSDSNKEKTKYIKKNIQIVFQNAFGAVNPLFSVKEAILEPVNLHFKNEMSETEKVEKAKHMMKLVGLSNIDLNQKARSLSGGQLQRLCIGRALMTNPRILILDEALSGLDPLVQKQILELLYDIKKTLDITYIFVVHDFLLSYYLCDEVIILDKGELVETLDLNSDKIVVKNDITKKIVGDFNLYV